MDNANVIHVLHEHVFSIGIAVDLKTAEGTSLFIRTTV